MTPLPIDEVGLSEGTLRLLARERDACAAERDYRAAATLQDLITVLTPRAITLADLSPQSLEDQAQCFYEHGMVVFPGAFQGEQLATLQSAFLSKERPAREAWEARQAATVTDRACADDKEAGSSSFPPDASQTFSFGFDF